MFPMIAVLDIGEVVQKAILSRDLRIMHDDFCDMATISVSILSYGLSETRLYAYFIRVFTTHGVPNTPERYTMENSTPSTY